MERLQKVLASAGLGSRRACEELILQGRVVIDGKIAKKLGIKVDVNSQKVLCDGKLISFPKRVYYLFHKPKGVLSTNEKKQNETTIYDFFKHLSFRVFPVGRLDQSSEGIILITNDGEFTQKILHPKYQTRKVYWVKVKGRATPEALQKVKEGIWFKEGKMRCQNVKVIEVKDTYTVLEMELGEGKNREIRRLLAHVGHDVKRLMRVKIGDIAIDDLAPGKYRVLEEKDVEKLLKRVKK